MIEVLVALVIVAITLGAGVKAAGALLRNAQRLIEVSEAQWCADNELTGMKLAKVYPGVGESTFGCEQLGRSYVGTFLVSATPNPCIRLPISSMVVAPESRCQRPNIASIGPLGSSTRTQRSKTKKKNSGTPMATDAVGIQPYLPYRRMK